MHLKCIGLFYDCSSGCLLIVQRPSNAVVINRLCFRNSAVLSPAAAATVVGPTGLSVRQLQTSPSRRSSMLTTRGNQNVQVGYATVDRLLQQVERTKKTLSRQRRAAA